MIPVVIDFDTALYIPDGTSEAIQGLTEGYCSSETFDKFKNRTPLTQKQFEALSREQLHKTFIEMAEDVKNVLMND